ncbi:MAG TPA: hypothetical protein PLK76_01045 [bacterium]|jgi:hypothetical protein|nr:hypothetical protein [bacterium]
MNNLAEQMSTKSFEDILPMNHLELLNLTERDLAGKTLDDLRVIKAELEKMSESPNKAIVLNLVNGLITMLEK